MLWRHSGRLGMKVSSFLLSSSKTGLILLSVFEWDASSHSYAYSLWAKAIFSDGGEGCRKKIEMTGEPLVEGMLVGTPEHILTTSETHQVRNNHLQ